MTEPDPAAKRFAIIQLTRFAAFACAFLGAVIVSERIWVAPVLGTVLLIGGAAVFFFVPLALAKRWKSGDK